MQFIQGICVSCSTLHGDERTIVALHNLAFVWLELQETVRHNRLACRHVQHVGTHTDDTTARNLELELYAVVDHLHAGHLALVGGYIFDDLTRALLWGIHGELLHRLALHAVNLLDDDLWLTHLQLVSLAAHGFYEHAEVQHTTAEDVPRVLVRTALHAKGEVLFKLFVEAFLDMARGHELTVLTKEWRVVDGEYHRHRWLINGDGLQCLWCLDVANSVANLEAVDADERAYITRTHFVGFNVSHARESVQLFDFGLDHRAVFLGEHDVLTVAQCTAMHMSHSDTAHIWVVVETGDEHLWCTLQHLWFGDILDDGIHQCGQVFGWLFPIGGHPAVLCRAIERLEIQLLLCGVEVTHQVKHLLLYLVGAAVEFIDFVDDYDRFEVEFECLLQHEARLWHRAFEGIHEQQHAVCHVQHALHLAAEIGVARSVNHIDFVALVFNRYVLC